MLVGRVHLLSARDVTELLYSCVRLRYKADSQLLTEIVDVVVGSPPAWLSLHRLADMTWGFASIGYALCPYPDQHPHSGEPATL